MLGLRGDGGGLVIRAGCEEGGREDGDQEDEAERDQEWPAAGAGAGGWDRRLIGRHGLPLVGWGPDGNSVASQIQRATLVLWTNNAVAWWGDLEGPTCASWAGNAVRTGRGSSDPGLGATSTAQLRPQR